MKINNSLSSNQLLLEVIHALWKEEKTAQNVDPQAEKTSTKKQT